MADIQHIEKEELQRQEAYAQRVQAYYAEHKRGLSPLAHIRTFGCQQNVADSERIKGMLAEMGFGFTEQPENADKNLY